MTQGPAILRRMGNGAPGGLKPWLGGGALVLIALLAFLSRNTEAPSSAKDTPVPTAASAQKPAVRATRMTTAPRPAGTARITGRVLGTSGPAAGVRVSASRVEPGVTLSERPCPSPTGQADLKSGACSFDAERMQWESVEARDGEAPVFAEAATDAEGRFVLEGLPEGPVTLWALGDTGAVSQGGVAVGSNDVTLTLEQGILFEGTVTDTDRKTPIQDARVTIVSRWHTRFFDAVTDAEGRFIVGPLPQGDYAAFATAVDRSPWFQPKLDGYTDMSTVVLARALSLTGQVLSSEGAPVPGILVHLEGDTATASTQRTTTDGEGRFRFTAPAVLHQLTAESGGAFATLDVTPPLEHVELRLQPGVFVTGTVRDDAGHPIPNARVETYREDGGPLAAEATTVTDAGGRYQLGPTRPGPHTFRILAPHHLDVEEHAQKLQQGMAPLDFTLRRAQSVEGRVVDTSGAPVEGILLSLSGNFGDGDDIDAGGARRSDATGHFVLDVKRAGTGELSVEDPSFQRQTLAVRIPSRDVVVVLDRGASVSGTVTDPQGLPLRGATVTLGTEAREDAPYEEPRQTLTDEQGRFHLQGIAPGTYLLEAVVQGDLMDASVSQSITFQAREHRDVSLRMEAGRERSGIAVDGTGQPLADVVITASSSGDAVWQYHRSEDEGPVGFRTGPDGRFTLRGLVASRYAVWADLPGYTFRPGRSQGGEPRADRGGLWVDSSEAPLQLVLERNGRLRGRVVAPGGQAVTSFQVKGADLHDSAQPAEWPDGAFDLPFGMAGPATLTVEADGFMPLERAVTLTEGVDLDLGVLTLDPGWTLRLAVHDAETGEALSQLESFRATLTQPGDSDIARAMSRPRNVPLRDGVYTLSRLPPPPFTLELRSRNTRPFELEVTARVDTLTVALDRAATVRLLARDTNGVPLPALVSLKELGAHPMPRYRDFAPGGTLVLRGVEPGEYLLDARAADPDEGPRFTPRKVLIPPRGEVTFTVEATPP
ncbi:MULTISPECIES: carboxypeptidase-like regulatory domain-containing protein [unclassified Corallococcus]|uniref:carboxypeptidase-like regulatory domain-containing protein n=1 Tax=unclassified Corallococcus TaxID=2685029 RepID=UPI001A8EB055|nr:MULTISPECIES: carboxypeptidase-like regulatory domain-containing protein [unclassified Corallococcus]MBN9687710.1 carboxypeptidase regulatory-like domain-containing protein [Corallococcus sp. NCSPR001]WAS88477.1 carboxypeptidase-like regulatory domain-containing protein [Corallococcus sp. NCRR]